MFPDAAEKEVAAPHIEARLTAHNGRRHVMDEWV
jgi:hypothetical protein